METDHLLRSPKNAERLQEAIARADAGEGESMTIAQLRAQFGLSGE
ncbi:MAG: addiction module antitoxin [Gemmatimonadetes bacterium]|nr:addiction module antitoxin [Gemmatimonadota bacterium]MYG23813.1 addiction module antitoxin [Gemmatimonadota bacterium]MYJ37582.1 addiction module antitoxin [Gemmatimonadota bacterium]